MQIFRGEKSAKCPVEHGPMDAGSLSIYIDFGVSCSELDGLGWAFVQYQ